MDMFENKTKIKKIILNGLTVALLPEGINYSHIIFYCQDTWTKNKSN
jgi:hypothetical protein